MMAKLILLCPALLLYCSFRKEMETMQLIQSHCPALAVFEELYLRRYQFCIPTLHQNPRMGY